MSVSIPPPDKPDSLYLTLDQGGHASRAIVFDAHGVAQARSLRPVEVFHPQRDWVEQDPEEIVASLNAAMFDVRRELGPRAARIVSAGLATQRSSIVCWDRITGEALSPVLSWQDRRAHAWLERLAPEAERIHTLTGLMLSAHYGASKLRWCLDHLPRVAEAASEQRLAFGPLAAYLVFRLTEARSFAVDPANAARTLLLGLKSLDWDEGLLHCFGIPRTALPTVVPNRFAYGALAVAPHIPLAFVTGDQSAALFAYGAPKADSAYLNIGTGAFVQRPVGPQPARHEQLLSGLVLKDEDESLYVLEGTVNGAGSALSWIGERLGLSDVESSLSDWLARDGDTPLFLNPLFLNGVGGLGSPWWAADFESRFEGGGAKPRQAVAVAESVVFLLQANLDLFRGLASPPESLVASGGLTNIDALCQRISDLSKLPLYRPVEHEATARGLAWLLARKPRDWPEPEPGVWFKPRANEPLARRYARWRMAMDEALARR